ncbi:MAG: hypothetical protein Q4P15_07310, partial [Propionibacteriaceae bacterium]|nr:hypothetical protein [Propionibacteriaceae bacterium]
MVARGEDVQDTDTDATEPVKGETREEMIRDLVAVLVLSTTAVLTAWCGFESSRWGGEMSVAFNQASSARVQASDFMSKTRDLRQLDVTMYGQWVMANATDDAALSTYIQDRFTPSLTTAFDAWVAEGRPESSPFMRADYVPVGTAEAAEFSERADTKFQEGIENNDRSDNYSFLTVYFAMVLFLIAVSKGKISALASRVLLVLGSVVG